MIISELNTIKDIKLGDVDISKVYSGEDKVFPEEDGYFYIFHESDNTVTTHKFSENLSTDIFKDLVNPNQFYFGFNGTTILDYSEIENKTGSEIYNLFGAFTRAKYSKSSKIIEKNKVYFVDEQSKDYDKLTIVNVDEQDSENLRIASCVKSSSAKSPKMIINDEEHSCGWATKIINRSTQDLFNLSGYFILSSTPTVERNKIYNVKVCFSTMDNIIIEYSQKTIMINDNNEITIN